MSSVLPVHPVIGLRSSRRYDLDLGKLTGSELRRAPDGWHAIVPLGGAKHRLWLRELPSSRSVIVVDLPLDRDFDIRLRAAQRFWRALEKRPLGPSPRALPIQTRHRLILALRAADGWLEGNSYREIAKGLFGARCIPDRGWKTSDVRSLIVRLVKKGLRLIRGGYRALLLHKRKDKYDES
ncbi:DUF2285 domain-containing protein [Bradyrhizobium sp. Cham227]|nr:DUF2285 domain-containing protein [Bradyrhizobium brasilense]